MRDKNKPQMHQLNRLQHIDTLILVLLALVSFGIYLAFYIRRQSALINAAAEKPEQRLSEGFTLTAMILASAALCTQLLSFTAASEALSHLNEMTGLLFNISLAAWGFAARRSLHAITSAAQDSSLWFDGLFTLLLSPFYFNYRINQIFKRDSLQPRQGSASRL